MKTFLKFIKYCLLALLLLVIIGSAIGYFYDDIAYTYNKITFEPPSEIHGISLGDSYGNNIFKYDSQNICDELNGQCDENQIFLDFGSGSTSDLVLVFFENRIVERVIGSEINRYRYNFYDSYLLNDTDILLDYYGAPDVLTISEDNLRRTYTYVEYGVTYEYEGNSLSGVVLSGNFNFRTSNEPLSEYYLFGNLICPGSNCPFEEEGNLKPENEGKSINYFDALAILIV